VNTSLAASTPTLDAAALTVGDFAYFRRRLRNRLYSLVITEFERSGITRAELARRMRRKPEIITRWLSGPGNYKLDTISDLFLAISASELSTDAVVRLNDEPPASSKRMTWIEEVESKWIANQNSTRQQQPATPKEEVENSIFLKLRNNDQKEPSRGSGNLLDLVYNEAA
jgi:hypothetical protein